MPSWRGAQLKHSDNFTLPFHCNRLKLPVLDETILKLNIVILRLHIWYHCIRLSLYYSGKYMYHLLQYSRTWYFARRGCLWISFLLRINIV